MTTHVLVPVDGSPLSEQALETAFQEHPDATITALHVIDPTEVGYSYYPVDSSLDLDEEPLHGSDEWFERAEKLTEELFEEVEEHAHEHGVDVETKLLVGQPGRAIVDYATDQNVDQILIGSHGRGEGTRILLGSVVEAVAFRAPMRVSLIR